MPRTTPDTPEQHRPAPRSASGPLFDEVVAAAEPAPIPPAVAAAATGMPAPLDPWLLLAAPFPPELLELKPGAVSPEKKRALALAYVDARHYQARLDAIVGPAGWSVEYRPLSDRAVLCRLTVAGIVREDVGEADDGDPNQATSAAVQAFKRACAAFGLGRYLYTELPQLWLDIKEAGRSWVFVDAAAGVRQMYDSAGIDLSKRGAYIRRIITLLGGLDEAGLIRVGQCAAGK